MLYFNFEACDLVECEHLCTFPRSLELHSMSTKRSKKKSKAPPTLHVHGVQEQVTSIALSMSQDGRRVKTKTTTSVMPESHPESLSPLNSTAPWDEGPPIEIHHELSDAVVVAKKPAKRYENSVRNISHRICCQSV